MTTSLKSSLSPLMKLKKQIILWKMLSQRCTCIPRCFSYAWLFGTLWTVAHQATLSMGFSRQEYWSGLFFPLPWDLSNQGLNLCLLGFLDCRRIITTEPPVKPKSMADDCKCDKVIFQRQKISLKKESFYSIWVAAQEKRMTTLYLQPICTKKKKNPKVIS